jgi:hypothetical protein
MKYFINFSGNSACNTLTATDGRKSLAENLRSANAYLD